MRRALVATAMLASVAHADTSTRAAEASPAVVAEVKRLLESAAAHATLSKVCMDGDGERTTIALLGVTVEPSRGAPDEDVVALSVTARYRVTVAELRGGECDPYPECAKPSPPRVTTIGAGLAFAGAPGGMRLIVPRELPAVPLKTPLDRKHSKGCDGDAPAFVPRLLYFR